MNLCSLREKRTMSNKLGVFEDKICECGGCGEFFPQSEMEQTRSSTTDWLCYNCYMLLRRKNHGKEDY